jgi:hypothetical protein
MRLRDFRCSPKHGYDVKCVKRIGVHLFVSSSPPRCGGVTSSRELDGNDRKNPPAGRSSQPRDRVLPPSRCPRATFGPQSRAPIVLFCFTRSRTGDGDRRPRCFRHRRRRRVSSFAPAALAAPSWTVS